MKAAALIAVLGVIVSIPAAAATRVGDADAPLALTNATIQTLVHDVGRSVVQVVVTGYQPAMDDGPGAVLVHARAIGSGAVIAPGGYIVTNAHVVAGAERIDIVLPDGDGEETPLASRAGRSVPATLVGVAPELDLALLQVKVDLPALTIAAPASVHQGELVFAFGSPDGLRNSVSMGLVSAVARQMQPSSPIAYIQTDSAINPGNSGGPLVNVRGELVGLNTFIRTQSGGSEGLGFALPSAIVALAYPQLREFGHLHRAVLGLSLQDITPAMKEGLGLTEDSGMIVADVVAGGPAAQAGLASGDVLTSIDGHPLASLAYVDLYRYLYALGDDQRVTLGVQRGSRTLTVPLRAVSAPHDCSRPTLLDQVEDDIVEPLGVIATAANPDAGVVVTARIATNGAADVPLAVGDVVRAINGVAVTSAAALRDAMLRIAHGHGVVLQVERAGGLNYVAFER